MSVRSTFHVSVVARHRRHDRGPVARPLLGVALSLLLAVAGCMAQLSPAYDQVTYANLVDLNVRAQTLFVSLSGGGTRREFPEYKAAYNELIGGFSAARMTTASREVPATSRRLLAAQNLSATCRDDPAGCVNPTPHHLEKIITLLTAMRDTHRRSGLAADLIDGFKRQYEIEMLPVLDFEAALQR
jgi:hypothetical protein